MAPVEHIDITWIYSLQYKVQTDRSPIIVKLTVIANPPVLNPCHLDALPYTDCPIELNAQM